MRRRHLSTLVLAGLASLAAGWGRAQPAGPAPTLPPRAFFDVPRASAPIVVDGVLDDAAWADAVVVPIAYEWSPGENVPPPVETQCLVTYDARHLYVAFRALDPDPSAIRATLMDRDDVDTLIQDDHVGLMIDTFDDERRAFQFRINPLGVQADAIFSEQDGVEDFSWDMIWHAAGRVTADGYVVELALPLKQLRFPAGAGPQQWGFEAFRSWPRRVRHRLSSQPRDRNVNCVLCQEHKIRGLAGLAQGRNLEVAPTATFSRTDRRDSAADPALRSGDPEADAGLSARWSVTSSVTLNGTVNPDFSQVEADVAQLDINQRFALFYPEKRPFFLEGIDYFTTPVRAVFTRTVADPYFGAKLTGKQGGHAMGVFVTRDRINNLVLPSNEGSSEISLDDDVTTFVGRYRRDLGASSTIGALYGGREGAGYHNRQAGVDLFWRPSASDALRVQYIRSDTAYPGEVSSGQGQPAGAFGGNATWIDYEHVTRNWTAFGSYEAYDSGFRSDTGFVPRVDYRSLFGQVARRWFRAAGGWFDSLNAGVRGWHTTDDDWTTTDQTAAAFVSYTGPYQTQAQFNMPRDVVVYQGVRYEYFRPNFYATAKPSGRLSLDLTARLGGGVDYANNRAATSVLSLTPSVQYRPSARLNLQASYTLDQLSVARHRLYRAHLGQGKAVFHLGVRTFVRAVLQYTDISRDAEAYTFPVPGRTRRFFAQYLFSYKLNPQTVLFAGYSDSADAAHGVDLRRTDRTFFLKLGYAWVL